MNYKQEEDKKQYMITIRVTRDEKAFLQALAEKNKMTLSLFVLTCIQYLFKTKEKI